MRYLTIVAQSMPCFFVVLIWGAMGIPAGWSVVASAASIGLGIVVGRFASAKTARGLLDGGGVFRGRRVPGGLWFFVALGLLGGIAAASMMNALGTTEGGLFIRVSAVILGSFLAAQFATFALVVLRLERAQHKHVYMGPGGFYFDNL